MVQANEQPTLEVIEISTQTDVADITTTMTQTPSVPVIDTISQTADIVTDATVATETEREDNSTQKTITGDAPLRTDVAVQTVARLPTRKSLLEELLQETAQDATTQS